jgi:hypothetical protein
VKPALNAEPLAAAMAFVMVLLSLALHAQSGDSERVLAESKGAVEKAWKAMQSGTAGRLPTLEGFAKSVEHPLDRYERGYYQATLQVTALPTGESRVRVTVKLTAWYNDPSGSGSGYQLVTSNGRLEADLLDQLSQQIAKSAEHRPMESHAEPQVAATPPAKSSAPLLPEAPEIKRDFSSPSLNEGLASKSRNGEDAAESASADKADSALRAEAHTLEEVLKNQAHPKNLIAVKKLGTPVVSRRSRCSWRACTMSLK